MTDRGVVRGRIDRDGRLTIADRPLAELNARAGGMLGEPLALPSLAMLTRLAGRLNVLIARAVTLADGDRDLTLWVRAAPGADGVDLALAGWRERPAWTPAPALAADADADAEEGGGWRWRTDAALRLTRVSPAAGARLGFDAAGSLGEPLTRLFRLGEGGDGSVRMLAAAAQRQAFAGQPATVRGPGTAVTLAAEPLRDRTGRFAGYEGRAEEAPPPPAAPPALSADFTGRLERALRGPLGRIVAHADSIHAAADGPLDGPYLDYAADIASAARHLLALVDDLADLEAIERPDFAVAAEPVDLADVARRAAGLLAVRAADSGVTIERPAADAVLPARGEFRRVLQVLVNLIGNAVRYSPEGGTVWVRVAGDGDRACVVVADAGRGIAAEDQARIFDKFERVDRSEPGGSGLGLYIARRLARAMGGELTVDSAPGAGARFVLALPAE
jgi:signal transduction histidine kinase